MPPPKKKTKTSPAKRPVAIDRFLAVLNESGIGDVTTDTDKECCWIRVEKDGLNVEFNFDLAGKKLMQIILTKDVIEKTSEEMLAWLENKKEAVPSKQVENQKAIDSTLREKNHNFYC